MSITPIPELERLLLVKADAERALRQPAPKTYADLTLGRTYPFRRDDLYDALTDDTLRAMVNVAKADDPEPQMYDYRDIDGETHQAVQGWHEWRKRQDLRAALFPETSDAGPDGV